MDRYRFRRLSERKEEHIRRSDDAGYPRNKVVEYQPSCDSSVVWGGRVLWHGMGLKAIAEDLGVSYAGPMQINADASAAIAIASRLGLGKVRHIEVTQLWLQEKVYNQV